MPLTFFDHGQGEAARADAQARVARAEAAQVEQLNRAELAAGRVRLERLLASVAEIDQATAEATALQAQARQLYTAGEATITELLEAFRSAEALELARLDRARELAQTRLSLMRATGSFFDAELDAACSAQERKR